MKRLLVNVCIASFVWMLPQALAADESPYIGNTIVCTAADGAVTKVWIKDGGKYTLNRGTGDIQGTYADDASGNTCFTETDPAAPAGTKPFCPTGPMHKVGDSWSMTDPAGTSSQCVLKEGTS